MEHLPYPFPAIVGQPELKTALLLALINPDIGGVLLSGPYGVGKTTAVRGLLDLLPVVEQLDHDEAGEPRTYQARMRLVELPLNARLDDVVGGVNERVALEQQRVLLEPGILARAHNNLLYVDEINLLDQAVVDAILDAAAQGRTLVRRGAMVRLYPSRFVLIGSMNPEEGSLRPQILDRLGLRVWVAPLTDSASRLEIYRRNRAFRADPEAFCAEYAAATARVCADVAQARALLPEVTLDAQAEEAALALLRLLVVPSHRAELVLLEAARARAAADGRGVATVADVYAVAPLALRHRRSAALEAYAAQLAEEDLAITTALQQIDAAAAPVAATSADGAADDAATTPTAAAPPDATTP